MVEWSHAVALAASRPRRTTVKSAGPVVLWTAAGLARRPPTTANRAGIVVERTTAPGIALCRRLGDTAYRADLVVHIGTAATVARLCSLRTSVDRAVSGIAERSGVTGIALVIDTRTVHRAGPVGERSRAVTQRLP